MHQTLGELLGKLFGPLFRSKKIIKKNIKTGAGRKYNSAEQKKIINGYVV